MFDRTTARKLLQIFEAHSEEILKYEVDAYGDFLHPLGSQATEEYVSVGACAGLQQVRRWLAEALRSTTLHCAMLSPASFYHIGSMKEYIKHLCHGLHEMHPPRVRQLRSAGPEFAGSSSCIMHSLVAEAQVGEGCVLEYSSIGGGMKIGAGCIVSSVSVDAPLSLPDNCFMQTLAVKLQDGALGFVTHVISVLDNPKAGLAQGATWMQRPLEQCISGLGLTPEDVWCGESERNLWNASLFTVHSSKAESVEGTLAVVHRVLADDTTECTGSEVRLSMGESISSKDLPCEAAQRTALDEQIAHGKPSTASTTHAPWNFIAVTCAEAELDRCDLYCELIRSQAMVPKSTIVMAVPDPGGARVGSGGATVNAIVVVAERLSAAKGFKFIEAEVLDTARVLVINLGHSKVELCADEEPPYNWCGRAFATVSTGGARGEALSQTALLLQQMARLSRSAPCGVWVCSSESFMIASCSESIRPSAWSSKGFTALAISSDSEYSRRHGVLQIGEDGRVENLLYGEELAKYLDDPNAPQQVPTLTGVGFFSIDLAAAMLNFYTDDAGLGACTYYGVDSGADPISFRVWLDLAQMLTLKAESLELDPNSIQAKLRSSLQSHVGSMHAVVSNDGAYRCRDSKSEYLSQRCPLDNHCAPTNSILCAPGRISRGAVVDHCMVPPECVLDAGQDSFCSGLDLVSVTTRPRAPSPTSFRRWCSLTSSKGSSDVTVLPSLLAAPLGEASVVQRVSVPGSCVLQQIRLKDQHSVMVLYRLHDPANQTVLGRSLQDFQSLAGLSHKDLWEDSEEHTLWNAKLYCCFRSDDAGRYSISPQQASLAMAAQVDPASLVSDQGLRAAWIAARRVSMSEILELVSVEAELEWQSQLLTWKEALSLHDVLVNRLQQPVMRALRHRHIEALPGFQTCMLQMLDMIAATAPVDIVARALATIATLLVVIADGQGGLRLGPAGNPNWRPALAMIQAGECSDGVRLMAQLRSGWMENPAGVIRAARHYDAAVQVCISRCVASAFEDAPARTRGTPLECGVWCQIECGARIDLGGGWSDTPPIAFEAGGAVTNVSVLLDGQRPIGARARIITEPVLRLKLCTSSDDTEPEEVMCVQLSDLDDYSKPQAKGSLLKAAVLCSGAVEVNTPGLPELGEQLMASVGGGIEIESWSVLPQGSGMGTSSILAGAVLAALAGATGCGSLQSDDLIQDVLRLEQMLTTGGGWQDQVGGLVAGFKIAESRASLPLQVRVKKLEAPPGFLQTMGAHLVLIYTGRTRLAKDILQNVLWRWYARVSETSLTIDRLKSNAHRCARAVQEGDIKTLGACLNTYWSQKKLMAPGCEPEDARAMIQAMSQAGLIHGASLMGAGGGGFMCVVTKEPHAKEQLIVALSALERLNGDVRLHTVEIDNEGFLMSHIQP
eukprot:TRINITY_DN10382_c0_g1_i1.p1 TRINITY_DN10382_c0_g1~~TRINITY_DN10382_c0_g1_i1.p1  ORF type:complete len:1410 (-),score=348.79 TRINITY_DN10382_c0_g1_i1:105-4334(-)